MRQTKRMLTLPASIFLLFMSGRGQNLTPAELSEIHLTSDSRVITNTLLNKGFKLQGSQRDEGTSEIITRWYFPSSPYGGEEVISYLIKSVDSTRGAKTTFLLYHPAHHKELIDKLLKSNFQFKGIQILENNNYSVFKKKKLVILTRELLTADNRKCFQVLVQTE